MFINKLLAVPLIMAVSVSGVAIGNPRIASRKCYDRGAMFGDDVDLALGHIEVACDGVFTKDTYIPFYSRLACYDLGKSGNRINLEVMYGGLEHTPTLTYEMCTMLLWVEVIGCDMGGHDIWSNWTVAYVFFPLHYYQECLLSDDTILTPLLL
jgi:hypothetical protein